MHQDHDFIINDQYYICRSGQCLVLEDSQDEDDSEEAEADEEVGPNCPVCRTHCQVDGPCEHLVSNWNFVDEGGDWAGPDYKILNKFEKLMEHLSEAALGIEESKDIIIGLLPKHLQVLLDPDFFRGHVNSCCESYVASLIKAGPTYLGSSDDESCSPAGGYFTNYWAEDAAACT